MMFQGDQIDGSWELSILITDIQVEKTLRVKGDVDYIGGVMFKLVESLGEYYARVYYILGTK